MSTRNFRRRSNRRRRRGQGGETPVTGEGVGQAPEGGQPEGDPRGARGEGPRAAGSDGQRGEGQKEGGQRRQRGEGQREGDPRGARGDGQRAERAERQRQGSAQRGQPRPPQRPAQPSPACPVCSKPVRELPMALVHKASGQPAHFDCIMRELREAHQLGPQEKLCYLGSGCFGVIQFRQPGGSGKFVIKQKIQYEEKETPADWKKGLLISP